MTNLLITQLNKQTANFKVPLKMEDNGFEASVVDANNNVHAAPVKGKLVHSSPFSAPYIFVKDTAEDVVSLKNAIISGKSDDYKLGRVNDLALKVGSLAIAGYLFTKKNTSPKKLMEFVGFGSFFASMALWPKFFIQLPAKLLHGIDVFQEYEDSQGRRKKFYQDPQYTPWDIYSPDEMEKMGDRLNIPKGIANRSDLTKEKAHKIALQSQTLWMLSAGFGVPIMSSFICSGIEKYLPKAVLNMSRSFSDNNMHKTLEIIKNGVDGIKPEQEIINTFNQFIKGKENSVITNEFISSLAQAVTGNELYARQLEQDLLSNKLFNQTNGVKKEFIDLIFNKFANQFEASGITREAFEANYAKYNNIASDAQSVPAAIQRALKASITKGSRHKSFDLSKIFKAERDVQNGVSLTGDAIKHLSGINKLFAQLSNATKTIYSDIMLKSGNSESALSTQYWQDFSRRLTDLLGLSSKEIKTITKSNDAAFDIVTNKLSTALKDDNNYNKQVNSLISIYSDYIKNLKIGVNSAGTIIGDKGDTQHINTIFDSFHNAFNKQQLSNVANFITGQGANISSRNIEIANLSKISGFSRSILSMDFIKRKTDGKLSEQIKTIANNLGLNAFDDNQTNSIIKQAEKMIFEGTLSDYCTKYNTTGTSGHEYKIITQLLFDEKYLSDKTINLFKDKNVEIGIFKRFLNNMYDIIGNITNPHFPLISTNSTNNSPMAGKMLPEKYHSMMGDKITSIVKKTCNQLTNTRIWTSNFAKLGIAVAAITVASQFFFGRLKDDIKVVPQESEAA